MSNNKKYATTLITKANSTFLLCRCSNHKTLSSFIPNRRLFCISAIELMVSMCTVVATLYIMRPYYHTYMYRLQIMITDCSSSIQAVVMFAS